MNRCPDRTQWVLFAAGETSPRCRRALQRHLESCQACRREVEAVERGLAALEALDREPAVRPQALDTLRKRLSVASARRVVRPGVLARIYPYRWAAAAAVIIAVALGYALVPPPSPPPGVPAGTRTAWMDETQFVDEIAEISAEIELLERGALATLWESGNGSNGTAAESIKGESRLPSNGLGVEGGVPG